MNSSVGNMWSECNLTQVYIPEQHTILFAPLLWLEKAHIFLRNNVFPLLIDYDANTCPVFWITIICLSVWHAYYVLVKPLWVSRSIGDHGQRKIFNKCKQRIGLFRHFISNTIILQIYYSPNLYRFAKRCLGGYNPFTHSCVFLFIETLVWFIFWLLDFIVFKKCKPGCEKFGNGRSLTAHNCYMDIITPIRNVFLVFVAQFGLIAYYVWELNGLDAPDGIGYKTHDCNQFSFTKWVIAVILTFLVGDDQVGSGFDLEYWLKLWAVRKKLYLKLCDVDMASPCCTNLHIFFRTFLDWAINSICRAMILGTAPIFVSVEGPLDFVKDVTAIFFMIKLDDMYIGGSKDLKEWKPWIEGYLHALAIEREDVRSYLEETQDMNGSERNVDKFIQGLLQGKFKRAFNHSNTGTLMEYLPIDPEEQLESQIIQNNFRVYYLVAPQGHDKPFSTASGDGEE